MNQSMTVHVMHDYAYDSEGLDNLHKHQSTVNDILMLETGMN